MADIQAFRGLRYNVERVGELSSVISPPYDIISPREQQFYLEQSPYNVIRLELGEELSSDSSENNRYTRAADTLWSWLKEGILLHDQYPALYIYRHQFPYEGNTTIRWGLTARVRLEDWSTGWVRPHEDTFQNRIGDRLRLLRSCRANLSPIMGMFRYEPGGLLSLFPRLIGNNPDSSVIDHLGVAHDVWVIRDEKSIVEVSNWCADKVLYIADGHHRYETALAYQREQKAAHPHCTGEEGFNFVMMTIMDAGDPGLVMLPTHRLVKPIERLNIAKFREELSKFFQLEELDPAGATSEETFKVWQEALEEWGGKGVAIGLYSLDGKRLCMLLPREGVNLQEMMPPVRSHLWKELDVAILHWIILRHIMDVDTPQNDGYLDYTQDGLEAIRRVDSGEYTLAFLMNYIPISRVLEVADTGDRMPQKFTYFYPKLPTGLAMNPLWDQL